MSFGSLLRILLALATALAAGSAAAAFDPVNDDTDIFLANPSFPSSRPNVLIFVDNTANWSGPPKSPAPDAPFDSRYNAVRTALNSVLAGVVNDSFNVGLSLFVETGNPNNNTDGSYVRFGIRQMIDANKAQLIAMINGLSENGDKGNNATYSLAMAEMFNYYAGRSSYSGHGKDKADAGNSIFSSSGRVALAGSPLAAAALPANGGSAQLYASPITDACQKNFIIVISNGEAADNAASLSTAQGFLAGITGTNPPATIPISPSGEQGLWADEYAKFMANSDCNLNVAGTQNVITYTLDIVPGSTGQGPSHTALLQSMATNGKGKYFAITDTTSTAQLENALEAIFSEVQAVNSVFASTTLPVSVNVRGTNLNQVYIGVFRPDPDKSPRWLGNLKLYKLGVDPATQNLFLADATGVPAENAATGFISANAQSFWTASSTFWAFRDAALNGTGGSSDLVDGDQVEKGGAAQGLRVQFPTSNAARNLYTCLDVTATGPCTTTGLSSTPFNTTNVTAGALGAFSTKSVAGLNSAGNIATATVTAHGWATNDVVKVSGATPTVYNGSFAITVVGLDTFIYTMASAPDGTRARVTAANHSLIPGDITCVQSQNPSGYNACAVPITRIDANTFDYSPGTPQTTAALSPFGTVWGGRRVTTAIGIPGGIPATTGLLPAAGFPNNLVKIVMPGHGYGAPGTTLANTYLYLTLSCAEWWCAQFTTATVRDADTLTLAVTSPPIPNSGINAAHVISPNHGFSTGQSITVSGALVAGYNGVRTVTRIDGNTFTFSSVQTTVDTSAAIRAGAPITAIIHPTTGNAANQDTATVTTATAHGFALTQSIQIFGTGGAHSTTANNCTYDTSTGGGNTVANWVVQSTPTTTTFTITGGNIDKCVNTVTSGIAGYAVTRIDPARIDTQANIIHWKTLAPTAINPLTTATGTIIAGRPIDADTALRDLIVNWVRSTDNKEDENLNGSFTDVRASVHGDVLHSRPATINYSRLNTLIPGTSADDALRRDSDIYVFYGSNDGIFHAVKGGALQKADGTVLAVGVGPDANIAPGTERWGFIPTEFFDRLARLRNQTPAISNLNQKDYFFDGSIGVYQKDVAGTGNVASPGAGTVIGVIGDNSGDKVHLYLSLRRGGNFIYALDVTNPVSPKLLWRKGNGDTGWGEVGQTWSEPKVSRVTANIGNPSNPENVVLIFAAGQDEVVEDINPCLLSSFNAASVVQKPIGTGTVTYTSVGACTIAGATGGATTFNRSKGRGMLVVDAFNGNVVWQVGPAPAGAANNVTVPSMTCAMPSDLTVLDKNRDGFADRLYAGDTCGNVWRADISSPTINAWAITRIANLSGGTVATVILDKRKFLFPPDLVFGTDAGGNYTAVLMGSGDREHPFDTTVQNAFFMVKDRDDPNPANPSIGIPNSTTKSIATPVSSAAGNPKATSDLFDATNLIVDGTDPTSLNGWFVNLLGGEKVIGSAVTIAGTTFFNTNQPSASAGGGACGSNLGIAREYLIGFADAAASVDLQGTGTLSIASRSTVHTGGGYLPSPVPVVVEIGGKKYQAVISGTSVRQPPGTTLDARLRTYWYKDLD